MTGNGERILVGVDGSQGSTAALRWALRYAGNCGGNVTALIAWAHPATYGLGAPMPEEDVDKAAQIALSNAVTESTSELHSEVPVAQEVVRGPAARALVDEAAAADLLVVGSHGHGGFFGAMLGSVSQQCVHHAPCPVVVVRHGRTRES